MKIWKPINYDNTTELIEWNKDRLSDFKDTIRKFEEDANLSNVAEIFVAFYWVFINSNKWLPPGYSPRYWTNRPKENIDGEKFTIGWETQDHYIHVDSYVYGTLNGLWQITLRSGEISTVLKVKFNRPKIRTFFGLSFKKQLTEVSASLLDVVGDDPVFITKRLLSELFRAHMSATVHFEDWQKSLTKKV